jgi:DNA-binding MarR family transcriptional regulator
VSGRPAARAATEPAGGSAPPRAAWPEPPPESAAGAALTELVLETFRLNGRLLEAAQGLAAEGGITAAWWQVLGGVLDEPRSVADVARRMGLTRQAVQRIADLLVARGLAEYRANPAHRRAKLLACTEAGYWAIRRIALAAHPWADRIGGQVGTAELQRATATMRRLVSALESRA